MLQSEIKYLLPPLFLKLISITRSWIERPVSLLCHPSSIDLKHVDLQKIQSCTKHRDSRTFRIKSMGKSQLIPTHKGRPDNDISVPINRKIQQRQCQEMLRAKISEPMISNCEDRLEMTSSEKLSWKLYNANLAVRRMEEQEIPN